MKVANGEILQCWIFLELVFVYFMYVETNGPTLEELAKVIDGEEAKVAHLDNHQVEKEIDIAQRNGDMKIQVLNDP